jgi:hypothetical protein
MYNPPMAEAPVLPGEGVIPEQLPRRDYQDAAMRALPMVLSWVGLAVYALAVWFDWLPWLRGWHNYPEGWTWRIFPTPPLESFVPVILAVAGIWATALLAERVYHAPRRTHSRPGRATICALYSLLLIVLGYALQLGLLGLKAASPNQLLVERETNRVFSGYFNLAASAPSIDTVLSGYPAVFATKICPHCHDHPPGPALYYWLNIHAADLLPADLRHDLAAATRDLLGVAPSMAQLNSALTDAQILGAFAGGTLLLLLSAAVVIPLFGLARRVGPPGLEFRLAALGLALPGLMLMAPEFDQIFATLAAAALYAGLRGLLAPNPVAAACWAAAAGLTIALGLFFSWGLAALAVALALLALACLALSRRALVTTQPDLARLAPAQLFAWGGALAAGTILPLAALALATNLDLLYILQYNLHNAALAEANRPYAVWLLFGPLDFAQFLGLPLLLAVLLTLVPRSGHGRSEPSGATEAGPRWYARINPYAVVFLLVVAGLDLAGKSKAEQGRLLIFLMPLALVSVYLWAGRRQPSASVITRLFFAQMLVCVVIGARWYVP